MARVAATAAHGMSPQSVGFYLEPQPSVQSVRSDAFGVSPTYGGAVLEVPSWHEPQAARSVRSVSKTNHDEDEDEDEGAYAQGLERGRHTEEDCARFLRHFSSGMDGFKSQSIFLMQRMRQAAVMVQSMCISAPESASPRLLACVALAVLSMYAKKGGEAAAPVAAAASVIARLLFRRFDETFAGQPPLPTAISKIFQPTGATLGQALAQGEQSARASAQEDPAGTWDPEVERRHLRSMAELIAPDSMARPAAKEP